MAKLTENQLRYKAEREKRRQETLQKKIEAQKKKELYGENWKKVERGKIEKEIEVEIGGIDTPKIYDFKDLYDYFDPISFYRNKANEKLKMDYRNFVATETEYSQILAEIDEQLNKDNKELSFANDGVLQQDSDYPINADVEDELTEKVGAGKTLNKDEEKEMKKIKKATSQAKAKGRLHQIVATYFNRFVPLYDKHVCTCCGNPKQLSEYYVAYNIMCCNRVDNKGAYHLHVCKSCCNKLLAYCYSVLADKKVENAMMYTCAYLNLYWDVDQFYMAKKTFEDSGRRGTLLGNYVSTINLNCAGLTFMDSPFIADEDYSNNNIGATNPNDAPFDWSKEDARNKSTVIKMVGYDPFFYESDENKKILYRDLLNILDEGMQNDLVKFQAGIQIVLSFFKIRQMNEREYKLNQENAPITELKALSDLKAKELKAISDFSKDNGFSERYATAKAKGENSMTGIMNKMDEQKYEKAILNRYDIETSATIQQAADASFAAIFRQLGMSESEVWKLCQDQFSELTKLRKENSKLQEDLRKAKYREAEVNLLEKEREKNRKLGLGEEEEC